MTTIHTSLPAGSSPPLPAVDAPHLNGDIDFEAMLEPTSFNPLPSPTPATAPDNLGDAILAGMQRMSETHQNQIARVEALVETPAGEPLSFQEGVRLQFELMQLGLHQSVTTKIADKSSQGIQTLFRNQ